MLELKVKPLRDGAALPYRATSGSAGLDLFVAEESWLDRGVPTKVPTGIAVEIPEGYCGQIITRSSIALENVVISTTLIDSDYRGELFITATNRSELDFPIPKGKRIAQLVILPCPAVKVVRATILSDTSRGAGGYGSTGA